MKLSTAHYGTFAAFLVLVTGTTSLQAQLITVTDSSVTHSKSLSISFFGTGVPLVGESASYTAAPGATSFSNTWADTASYSGVTVIGNSSLDYDFRTNTFTFSTATDTSRSGTSAEDITAVPGGSGALAVTFTLDQAAIVSFNTSGLADNNGTGGSGGAPFALASLQRQTGVDPGFGFPIYEAVFPAQSAFDSTVGNGSTGFSLSDSALLAPGIYRISASAAVQNFYHQRLTGVSSSAQSASVNLTAHFDVFVRPTLAIAQAVVLSFQTAPGVSYNIEESENMAVWTNSVEGIQGDGSLQKFFFESTTAATFYRLTTL